MMGQTYQQANIHYLLNDSRLAAALEAIDDLHDSAADGTLSSTTSMSKRELVCWLRDLVYTAQETINEIESGKKVYTAAPLRLVK
jgi:predicted metal-dependent HD superfamily phosphohydrolase